MSSIRVRTYSRYSYKAAALMGTMIRLYRKQRKMTAQDLADRAGISRATLRKIENGDMKCEIGLVFEIAALVGIKLFDQPSEALEALEEKFKDKLALLPKNTYSPKIDIDDAF